MVFILSLIPRDAVGVWHGIHSLSTLKTRSHRGKALSLLCQNSRFAGQSNIGGYRSENRIGTFINWILIAFFDQCRIRNDWPAGD